jgi:hypothetical protein
LNKIYLKKIEKNTEKFDLLGKNKLDFSQNTLILANVLDERATAI